jgi:hypothetical protein
MMTDIPLNHCVVGLANVSAGAYSRKPETCETPVFMRFPGKTAYAPYSKSRLLGLD